MPSFTITREIAAPPAVVFETVTDHRRYPDFTPIRRAELEREGEGSEVGVGAVRVLRVAGPPIREEVIACEPPELFTYRLLSGLPVRDHVGTVRLEATGEGTRISYSIETTPRIPFTGPVVALGGRAAVGRLLAAVASEAERRAAAER